LKNISQRCAETWSAQVRVQTLAEKNHTTKKGSETIISAVTLPDKDFLKTIALLNFYFNEKTVIFIRPVKDISVTKCPGYDFSN
jgi:hypothetical protein